MKDATYLGNLNEMFGTSQFEARNGESENITVKTDKQWNNSLHQLMKHGTINEKIFQKLKTIGLQAARLYGLANVPKNGTLLRFVLSVPGSS